MRKTTTTRNRHRRSAAPAAFLTLAILSLAVLSLAVARPAYAEPANGDPVTCGAREAIIERLAAKYEEQPVSRGVTATGSLLEVLASPAGSWTVIVTIPGGPTCLVSSGEGWHDAPVQLVEGEGV